MHDLSILVPSRERAKDLKFSLDSLGLERNNIEALVWVDSDDPQLQKYNRLFGKNKHIRLFVKPRVGYLRFHKMINYLASRASGDWLMLWNDDAYMAGLDWYDTFIEYASLSKPEEEPVVINTRGRYHNVFPIVSRKYLELLGHLSGHSQVDIWISTVGFSARIQRYIPGITPLHGKAEQPGGDLVRPKDNTGRYVASLYNKVIGRAPRKARYDEVTLIINWLRASENRNLRTGFIGFGRLGLPIALAIENRGKNIVGFDVDPKRLQSIRERKMPFADPSISQKLLRRSQIMMVDSVDQVIKKCSLVFCAIQDHDLMKEVIKTVANAADSLNLKTDLVMVSHCEPGTFDTQIRPLLSDYIYYFYSPLLNSSRPIIRSFYDQDFVLIGSNVANTTPLKNFYKFILGRDKFMTTDVETAERFKLND